MKPLPLPHPCSKFYENYFWLAKKLYASEFAFGFFKVLPLPCLKLQEKNYRNKLKL